MPFATQLILCILPSLIRDTNLSKIKQHGTNACAIFTARTNMRQRSLFWRLKSVASQYIYATACCANQVCLRSLQFRGTNHLHPWRTPCQVASRPMYHGAGGGTMQLSSITSEMPDQCQMIIYPHCHVVGRTSISSAAAMVSFINKTYWRRCQLLLSIECCWDFPLMLLCMPPLAMIEFTVLSRISIAIRAHILATSLCSFLALGSNWHARAWG